ncbi:MAG: hypothetical protein WDW38_007902 [Sanguina aurantia]
MFKDRVEPVNAAAPSAITALSHDGSIAAVGGRDMELYLWDVLSGNMLTKIEGHDIHWASSRDMSFFVTCQEDGSVVMWDKESMRMQMVGGEAEWVMWLACAGLKVLGEIHEGISCLSISPSDRVVHRAGGELLRGGHTGPVALVQCCTTVEGDDVVVSCGASDHTIVVWDLQAGDQLMQMTITELQAAKNIKYDISADSRLVLMMCVDAVPFPNLFLVHLSTGAKRCVSCHDGIIRHGCLGRGAHSFATCGSDGKVVLWDSEAMEPRFTMAGHVGAVVCVDMDLSGERIVSAGDDCTLRLWSATDGQQLMVFEAQDEPLKMVAFAAGSASRVISSDISGRTYVWSLHSEFLLDLIRRYVDSVSCFTMSADQRSAVLGCNNGRVMLWDMESRELQWEYSHHTGRVEAATFNSSLTLVATVGADGCVSVIHLHDGKQANSFTGNDNPLVSVAFSPDDERIAANSADGKVLVYMVSQHQHQHGRKARLVLENQISRVTCFVFSPNSKLIVGCGADGSVLVWNVNTGSISTALEGEAAAATCCCFDLIGKLLAVGNVMGNTLLFNLETAELLCELKGNASPVRELTFNKDTTKLTTICSRQAIIWDMSTAQKSRLFDFVIDATGEFKAPPHPYRTTISHTGTILFDHEAEAVIYDMQALVDPGVRSFFLSDTRAIAAGSNTRCARLVVGSWPAAYPCQRPHGRTMNPGVRAWTMPALNQPPAPSPRLQPPSRCTATASRNRIAVWSGARQNSTLHHACTEPAPHPPHHPMSAPFSNAQQLCGGGWRPTPNSTLHHACTEPAHRPIPAHQMSAPAELPLRVGSGDQRVGCVRLSADNSEILSCGSDSKVILWDWRTRTPTRIYSGHFISIGCCDLAEQGDRVVSGDNHGMICVWEKDSGTVVQTLPLAHAQAVLSVSMSADGSTVASVGADDKVSIWNVDLGIELVSLSLAIESQPLYCAFSPDGNKLAVTESNGNVLIWNVRAGCQWTILTGAHKGKVSCCDWSADCRRFVTSGADSSLAIWDAESGAQMFRFHLKSGPLTTCSVSPQGLYVATGSSSGTLSVCNVAHSLRATPEPSFLYHWLSTQEDPQQAVFQFIRLFSVYSHIINVQDARGWSLLLHAVSRGNAAVASMIFDVLEPGSANQVGAISAVPFSIQTRVKFHNQEHAQGMTSPGADTRMDEAEPTAHSVRRERRMSTLGPAHRQRRKSTIAGVGILGTGSGMMHDGFGAGNTALLNLAASQGNMGSFLNLRKGSTVKRLGSAARFSGGQQNLGEGVEAPGSRSDGHTGSLGRGSGSGSGRFTGWGCGDRAGASGSRRALRQAEGGGGGGGSSTEPDQHHHRRGHGNEHTVLPQQEQHQQHGQPTQQEQQQGTEQHGQQQQQQQQQGKEQHGQQWQQQQRSQQWQQQQPGRWASQPSAAPSARAQNLSGGGSTLTRPPAAVAEANEAELAYSSDAGRGTGRAPARRHRHRGCADHTNAWSSPRQPPAASPSKARRMSVVNFFGGGWGGAPEDGGENELTPNGAKSFSHNLRKVAVELFTEKREIDEVDLIQNNALALALNSKSSMCVQVILDAVCSNKVSLGSYHAITDIIPSLALRYPIMCYMFLANLEVRHLADLEVPVAVLKGIDESVIRTAPIFTNVKSLWQGHLKLHEVRHGPQPYAHVKASMVLLPYACSIGRESLLHTLVESSVPVKAFGTPSIRAVIKHKWRLYARNKIAFRAVVFLIYVALFTVFGILYAQEDTSRDIRTYWASGLNGKVHLILDVLLFAQTCWYAWTELSQMYAAGLHYYLRSYWNVLDICSILLMLVINPFHVLRIGVGQRQALSPMIAFELILVYFKTMFFGLAFEPTGPFIHMVLQIGWGIRTFVVLLAMVCCCFSVALLVLYQYVSPATDTQFTDFGASSMTMWRAVLGQFDMSGAYSTGWGQITLVIFSLFLFSVQILLLNMLIALMRDVYLQVRLDEEDVFLKGRAMIIIEIESLMTTKQLDRFSNMPPYVHLLTPVTRKVKHKNNGPSDGRLERLETMMLKLAELVSSNRSAATLMIKGEGAAGAAGANGSDSPRTSTTTNANALSFARPSAFGAGPERERMLRERVIEGLNTDGMSGEQVAYLQLTRFTGCRAFAPTAQGAVWPPHVRVSDTKHPEAPPCPPKTQAARLRDADQLAAILRQVDRLQRTVNTQEMRLEGVVTVLRDIEALLRNQQPVIIHQETRPSMVRKSTMLTAAELEAEVSKMLGNGPEKSGVASPIRNRKPFTPYEVATDETGDLCIHLSGNNNLTTTTAVGSNAHGTGAGAAPGWPASASLDSSEGPGAVPGERPSSASRGPQPAPRSAERPSALPRTPPDGSAPVRPSSMTVLVQDRVLGGERPSSAGRDHRPSSASRLAPRAAAAAAARVSMDSIGAEAGLRGDGGGASADSSGRGGGRGGGAGVGGVVVEGRGGKREAMPWEESLVEVIGSGSEQGAAGSYGSDSTGRGSDASGAQPPARVLALKPGLHRLQGSPPPPQQPQQPARGVQPLRTGAQLPPGAPTLPPLAIPSFHPQS